MLVKVITGMRGSGKTTLLSAFANYLQAAGVSPWQIISLNFENMPRDTIRDYQQLYTHVYDSIQGMPRAYLLLDEVSMVQGWEKAVNAFFLGAPVDVYIAGTRGSLLTEDFLKLFEDRYRELSLQPLSFHEYMDSLPDVEEEDKDFIFPQYLKYGSLPVVLSLSDRKGLLPMLLSGIYHTALMKDVVEKYAVRDPALMDVMARFLASSLGKPITSKRVNSYLAAMGLKTTGYTVDNYLQMLTDSGLFHRIRRYDIKAKANVNGSERFYMADMGLVNMLKDFQDIEDGALMENAVCIELLRRGYKVSAGKIGAMEVTFVADSPEGDRLYCQVVPSLQDEDVMKRTLRPLKSIPDQYGKMTLSMDRSSVRDFDGILNRNIVDFLMERKQ